VEDDEPANEPIENPKPLALFHHVFKKKIKDQSAQDEELMDMFKQVNISIPLVDAIRHVLTYAKFLKGLCTLKR